VNKEIAVWLEKRFEEVFGSENENNEEYQVIFLKRNVD